MLKLHPVTALFLAGCSTAQFATPTGPGKALTGQMQYSGKKRSIIGDFTARVSGDDFQIDLSKSGVPVISVHESDGKLARFEGGGHSWQGSPRFAWWI